MGNARDSGDGGFFAERFDVARRFELARGFDFAQRFAVAQRSTFAARFVRCEQGRDLVGNALLAFVIALAVAVALRAIEPVIDVLRFLIETTIG